MVFISNALYYCMYMNYKKLFGRFIFVFILFFTFFSLSSNVYAGSTPTPLTGWGWSSGIGWISLSCANTQVPSCSTAFYGVGISTTSPKDTKAKLSGYAWSSNIGWIKFAGDGTLAHPDPSVDLETGSVNNWVRACAGTITGDCSVSTSRTDGWDGWIELSGPNHITGNMEGKGGITYDPSDGYFFSCIGGF